MTSLITCGKPDARGVSTFLPKLYILRVCIKVAVMHTSSAATPAPQPGSVFSPAVQGFCFALAATVVWSFNFVAGRGLADSIPPCTLAFSRWLVAFCLILPLAVPGLRREWRHYLLHWRYYLTAGALGIAFFNTALYWAAHSTSALNMSLIATSTPLFTVLLGRVLFGERIRPARIAGIATAIAGILLLISRGDLNVLLSLSFSRGDLLVVLSSLSFSVYTILVRKQPAGNGGIAAGFAVTFGIGLLLLLPLAALELALGQEVHFSPKLAAGILYMGLGASLLAFWCWSRAIAAIGPARAAIIYYSLPLFSGLEAVLFLGEPVLWVHFASGLLILGGLILATRESGRQPGRSA